ncbi:MAG: SusC/RagA family TonB-linked outer membrane protein [Phocaeicola sp.]
MKRKLMLLMTYLFIGIGLVNAQISKVTGHVTSEEDGLPVVGASILVKGTAVGTVTDIDGNFTLTNVPSSAKTLLISFIGLQSQEVAVKPVVKVVLKSDAEVLDEVVVTAYGTSTKGSFTGSASVMKADKIEKRQVSNVSNALAGAVAGVQILSNNGQPGESAKVRIRGVGSINAGTDPLYVVDGVPYDGDLSSINSADIESMTVLKDAASTALYGARGANGIIMITTKKGTSGKARVNFDAKWGVNSRAVKNYDVMTSPKNYMEKAYEAIYNGYTQINGYPADIAHVQANKTLLSNSGGGVGYPVYTVPAGQLLIGSNGMLNPNATLGYMTEYGNWLTPDNWEDEMFQNKLRQEYNINVAGGNDKSTFYMAFGYLDDQGVIEGSGFTRFSGRLKGDYKVTDWLKVGANVNYINSESRYPGDQTNTASSGNAFYIANNIAPIYPMYVRGEDKQIMTLTGRPVYDYGDGKSVPGYSRAFMQIANPAGDLVYNKTNYMRDVFNTNWFAELTPIKGLTVSARFGLNVDNTRLNLLNNPYMGQSAEYNGEVVQAAMRTYGLDQQYVANYNFTLQDIHHFDITAGYDGYTYEYTELSGQGQNLYDPESEFVSNTIDKKNAAGFKQTYATEGFFGRVNYSYDDKYFGNVSYRRDASSRFSPDNRWGDFWAASVAWMITREEFMKNVTWVNMLKLKASFGQQGNDDLLLPAGKSVGGSQKNFYPWMDQYSVMGANGIFSDGTLFAKGNKDITWETSTSYNVGLEFALFNNRLNGSAEYFARKSSDMLYNKPIAGSMGYTYIPMNVGSMTNSGFELDLSYQIFNRKNFSWDVNFNATFVKNKINELHPDLKGQLIDGSSIYEEGESMYRMYLVKYAGVDEKTGEALYWAKDKDGKEYATAKYSLAQTNKAGTDNLMPKVYGGFGTSIEAYGFDASIQLSYQLGGQIYDSGYRFMMAGKGEGQNWHKDIYNAWTPANTKTDVPRLNAQDSFTNALSDRWLISSNYLSINNITVGYTLPSNLVKKMFIEKLRVYFTADNVGLIAKRKGLDPRQSYTTSTNSLYSPIRTISGGISLTF